MEAWGPWDLPERNLCQMNGFRKLRLEVCSGQGAKGIQLPLSFVNVSLGDHGSLLPMCVSFDCPNNPKIPCDKIYETDAEGTDVTRGNMPLPMPC